jgi:hypothetical protein
VLVALFSEALLKMARYATSRALAGSTCIRRSEIIE